METEKELSDFRLAYDKKKTDAKLLAHKENERAKAAQRL